MNRFQVAKASAAKWSSASRFAKNARGYEAKAKMSCFSKDWRELVSPFCGKFGESPISLKGQVLLGQTPK